MSDRIRKVNELIRELVATSIQDNISREYISTVTSVDTSRDMKNCVVWVSAMNNEEGFLAELDEKKNRIRHEVTGKMYSKFTPLIEFKIDHSGAHAQKIEELLNGKEPDQS